MQACDRCHVRKTRCDRRIPQCGACEKAGAPCVHADKLRQRNLPRGYLDSIESLLKELRVENKKLRDNLASAQAEIESRTMSTNPPVSHASSSPSDSRQVGGDTSASLSSKGSTDSNAFAVEVGYLSLIATGETRYVGSSSGLGLANIIQTVVSVHGGMGFLAAEQDSSGNLGSPRIPLTPSDSTFPTLATAMPYIDAYFQHTHISFPLLHQPTFLATVERIYSEPGFYETQTFDAFVFDMVLTIGSSNFNRFEETATGTSMYFTMAQSKVNAITQMPSLESLKVILLISQHGIFSNLRDTSASIWHLTGIGAQEEMRKRCFWCLYNLDRTVSITLGRPVAIRDDEIDISLPSHLDDDCFGPNCPIQVDPQESANPIKISPFLHIIRIRRLSGQILSLLYNSRQHFRVPIEEKRRIRRKFHEEINAWKKDTERLHLNPTATSRGYVSSFMTEEWYNAVYNNAILLLYRPSPYLPHPMLDSDVDAREPELMSLLHASQSSIESYSQLHRKRRLNYSWITLHGVFIAGLAYIYSVGRILSDPSKRNLVPNIMCIIEVTQGCSHVLVAICERWNASRRSCELFNKLSTSVIRDTLNAVSNPSNSSQPRDTQVTSGSNPGVSSVSIPQNQTTGQNVGIQPNDSHNSPMGLGIAASEGRLDDVLVMDKFTTYQGSFDFIFQRESSLSGDFGSGLTGNWPFDLAFNNDVDVDNSQKNDEMIDWSLEA
ncbi:hypothetical protein G7Z17_g643 [Cylindrodendrum hubeiense]|uniref:Zn(2)-C6 fungal-type domain-containing protein n=1 Tax=Cylindrodendrum hubeiense TaxID=595255 RepID=A0A9P5LD40_9HYPO|nr:hypothetical protein G7Z17_g643 [Cylindrodendrum hubeiense]